VDGSKRALLIKGIEVGSYARSIIPPEIRAADSGDRFSPLELASLLHEKTPQLAIRVRTEAGREA
jgi:hypothetical protein